jgi:hypothetical protein
MKWRWKIAIGVGCLLILIRLNYDDPMDNWTEVQGSDWGDDKPKSRTEVEKEKKIQENFQPYNNGRKSSSDDGYETIEVIRETQYPGTNKKLDIKRKKNSEEIDLTDPYIQDRIEDEMSK